MVMKWKYDEKKKAGSFFRKVFSKQPRKKRPSKLNRQKYTSFHSPYKEQEKELVSIVGESKIVDREESQIDFPQENTSKSPMNKTFNKSMCSDGKSISQRRKHTSQKKPSSSKNTKAKETDIVSINLFH